MLKGKIKTAFSLLGACQGLMLPLQAEEIGLYNQSAMVACENSWDIVFNADYIYWVWQQESMSVGTLVTPTASGAAGLLSGSEKVIFQSPGYTSGFQVGLGCNFHGMDDWRLKADYTWYQNSNILTTVTGSDQYFVVSPSFIVTPGGLTSGVLLSDTLVTTAQIDYDELDVTLQRIFYQGRRIITRYSMGLKALWIDEYGDASGSNLSFIGENINFVVPLQGTFETTTTLQSWALGPVFGFEANWLLGYGFGIEGNLRASLLYTNYTKLKYNVSGQISDTGSSDLTLNQSNNFSTIAPVFQASFGAVWGSYLCNKNLYLDLYLGYDFNIYWTRSVLDSVRNNNGAPGNLALQGLNARVGIDY